MGIRGSDSDARKRSLPVAQRERECVPAARPSLRGAEPDQGFAGRPRLDDSDSHREREEYARGSAVGEPGCESVYGDALDLQDGTRRRNGEDQEPAPGRAVFAGQYLLGTTGLSQGRVDDEIAGRRRKEPLCGIEAGFGRSLPASAWNVCENA